MGRHSATAHNSNYDVAAPVPAPRAHSDRDVGLPAHSRLANGEGVAEPVVPPQPFYARMLRLSHINPGRVLCFFFSMGAVALSFFLALTGLVSWWGMLAIPVITAGMVKLNDVVAGLLARYEHQGKRT